MRRSRTTFAVVLGVVLLFAVAAPTAKADIITFTFTETGTGFIGATAFSGDLVTVTAIGNTSAVFELPVPPYDPDTFDIVPTQFSVSISGVGTADFTGTGAFGGNGYVFDNETVSVAGFGITSDVVDISNSAFATYDLSSSIGPISGVSMNFDAEPTTLGPLILFGTVTPGIFTAQVSTVPEPSSFGLLLAAFALLGTSLSFRQQRRRRAYEAPRKGALAWPAPGHAQMK